jgi:polysaccharide export outer membrane protein
MKNINYSISRVYKAFFVSMILFISSCNSYKNVTMFQGEFDTKNVLLHTQKDIILQKNDILEITLITSNEEFSKLFQTALESNVRNQLNYTSGAAAPKGFSINQDGTFDLPYAGKIYAHGKTRDEIKKEIVSKLKEFIIDPVILIKVLNFKISVLGDVKAPGTFNIPNEKVSIIEAIGIANDINITADLKNAVIIRETDSSRIQIKVDLTKKDVFKSDVYFLKQNDIVYIPPNKAKAATSKYSPIYIPLLTSLSIFVTALNLIITKQ